MKFYSQYLTIKPNKSLHFKIKLQFDLNNKSRVRSEVYQLQKPTQTNIES